MKRSSEELLAFIFERIGKIATITDNAELFEALAKMGRDIVFADRCTIWILDKKKKKLWTKVAQGVGGTLTIDAYSGIVGFAIQSSEPIILNDVYKDTRFNPKVDEKTGYKTETMMVIPMKNRKNEVVGAIQVINKKKKKMFSEEDMKYLVLTSTYVTETIRATLLLEEIDATQRELIYTLGVVGESRSEETASHVKRVSEYSYLLGQLYGLSQKECVTVRDVAPMHDIGKIAIPDAILQKNGCLDDAEKKRMMTHPELGHNIFKNSERGLLKAAAIVAYEHHEKYDGSGYPRGLKGKDIHIFGRIVALADVFDALSSERYYKKAWEKEKILAYIKKEKGKHFDPELVELFMDNYHAFLTIQKKFTEVLDEK